MLKGEDVLAVAAPHIGERYVFGARADLDDPHFKGPWDCAEFASWCVKQAYGVVFGVAAYPGSNGPDPWSQAWIDEANAADTIIGLGVAAKTCGAFLLREPGERRAGHVAISDGAGGTIEAHSTRTGVIAGRVAGRLWHGGCLIPGVRYTLNP